MYKLCIYGCSLCSFGISFATPILLYIRIFCWDFRKKCNYLFGPIFRHSDSNYLSAYNVHIYLFIDLLRVIHPKHGACVITTIMILNEQQYHYLYSVILICGLRVKSYLYNKIIVVY